MKKYLLGAVFSLALLASPTFSKAAALTNAQAETIISVVKASPSTPASAFVNLITAFSGITDAQAASLIVVVQSSPNTAASVFVPLLTSFTSNVPATQPTTQPTTPSTSTVQPSITILSPNGGGTWYRGDNAVVTWATTNISSNNSMTIRLRSVSTNQEYNLRTDTSNDGREEVPVLYGIPIGSYKLEIKTALNDQSYLDASDSYFKVVDPTTALTAPVISVSPDMGVSTAFGGTVTFNWKVNPTTGTTCSAAGNGIGGNTGSGATALNGTWTTPALYANTTYGMVCSNSAGTTYKYVNVTVTPQTSTVAPQTSAVAPTSPTVSAVASPTSISAGQSSILTWVSTNATSCVSSGVSQPLNGSATVSPSVTTTYTITCSGASGTTPATDSVTVTVTTVPASTTPAPTASAPTVTLTSAASSVASGQSTTLEWHVSPTTSTCSLSATGLGTIYSNVYWKDTTNWGTASITADTTYTLSCTNAGSAATTRIATITIAPPPTVRFTQGTTDGSAVNVAWTTDNATSCTIEYRLNNGAWTYWTSGGSSGTASAALTAGIWQARATCTGPGGTTTSSPITHTVAMNASGSNANQMASALNAFGSAMGAGAAGFGYTWNRDLQIGSPYFADVSALQTALARENVYTGEITGGFYNQTFAAVKTFQQKYGIEATGFVGPATRAKLNALYSN